MVEKVLHDLKTNSRYKERVEHVETLPESEARYGEIRVPLPKKIKRYLEKKKIKLYKHQCDTLESLRAGRNVIVTTPTASGKTLAFNVPIFERLYLNKTATALYFYPTKALSNDQLKSLEEFEELSGIEVQPRVYDGDTSKQEKAKARSSSRIIVSNPYELHLTLSWHKLWRKFFQNLQFVVVDEAHQYRGVFGSNVAFLFRRLRRILRYYGANPQFVLATATIANPLEFSKKLTGVGFELIKEDFSPRGKKHFVFYNPYFNGAGELSPLRETRDLFLHLVRRDLQTICFTPSRKMAELVTFTTRQDIKEDESYLREKITTYRGGYLPEERREIEDRLKSGELRGVSSTNALELGVDIGSLDSVIISGYPGTIMSTWQQAGRAGRAGNESIVALVAFQNQLDQYFMKHPEMFFEKSHEHAIVDLVNPYILSQHLLCAANELPLIPHMAEQTFGDGVVEVIKELESQGKLKNVSEKWVYSGNEKWVSGSVSLNAASDRFKVLCGKALLETMDRAQAYREAHKNAVLLHQGETYLVEELDLENKVVRVTRNNIEYHTEALKIIDIENVKERDKRSIGAFAVSFGDLEVMEQYIGYKKVMYDKVVGTESLNMPSQHFKTKGFWFTVPADLKGVLWERRMDDKDVQEQIKEFPEDEVKDGLFAGGLHGAEHAIIGVMPFHVMCDRRDLGGLSASNHSSVSGPAIFIYDGFEGGIGLTEKGFELIVDIVKMALELVKKCPCSDGCPACIYSPKCGNENWPVDKKGTIFILKEVLQMMIGKRIEHDVQSNLKRLKKDLQSSDVNDRVKAAWNLSETLGEKDIWAVEALIKALADENLKKPISTTLCNIGDVRATEPLIQLLKDEDEYTRKRVIRALGNIGDLRAIEPLLWTLHNDKESSVRKLVPEALGMIGDRSAVESLLQVLEDDDKNTDYYGRELRNNAVRALGMIGDKRANKFLIRVLVDINEDGWIRGNAAWALGEIGDKKVVEYLIQVLRDEDDGLLIDEVQVRVIEALEKIGDPRAIESLNRALKDKDWSVREAAKKALDEIKLQKEKGRSIRKCVCELVESSPFEDGISREELAKEAQKKFAINREKLEETVNNLLDDGILFEPVSGWLKLV